MRWKPILPCFPCLSVRRTTRFFRINIKVSETEEAPKVLDTSTSPGGDYPSGGSCFGKGILYFRRTLIFPRGLFGESALQAEQLTITGSQPPEKLGDNYFWLSLSINATADLLHKVGQSHW